MQSTTFCRSALLLTLLFWWQPAQTQELRLETRINALLRAYAFTPDNALKIAAYAELKGQWEAGTGHLYLKFGDLGQFTFFSRNLLLRLGHTQVFHLNKFEFDTPNADEVNRQLTSLFGRIMLMGNPGSTPEVMLHTDRWLARINLEPFDKLYLRHILVQYGRLDPMTQEIRFDTRWLPSSAGARHEMPVRATSPMTLVLSEREIRGHSLESGGQVFVSAVSRPVVFASGETYSPNVTAFKVFSQRLFVQTIQHISASEAARLEKLPAGSPVIRHAPGQEQTASATARTAGPARIKAPVTSAAPQYSQYSWIPMMLNMLRSQRVNIGDPDMICYFVGQPYFPALYHQLNAAERTRADAYMVRARMKFPVQPLPDAGVWLAEMADMTSPAVMPVPVPHLQYLRHKKN
ncbi:MAG: hypothetical protein SF053_15680 [Bacteroidia bacterium]|nr:hypothetical protein [Bacteroidia bacterium]